tara:strand:+ start:885 stop:1967 length:1083 start_codon:yes stop_codon:yes gene_type:complete
MIKTIFPSKDATLYEHTASMNTGLDPILDIQKDVSGSGGDLFRSRAVIQFDTDTVSASLAAQGINTGSDSGSLKYFLKMFVSEEVDVPLAYKLVVHPIREGWTMGSGKFTSSPIVTNGCSWTNKGAQAWEDAGGYFFSGSHASESVIQTFSNVTGDIEVDVTEMIETIHSGTRHNFGFIVKRVSSEESDENEFGKLSYYSRETNTIYPPKLEARYKDVSNSFDVAATGSEVTVNDIIKIRPRLQPEYRRGDTTRIFVDIDKQYSGRSQVGAAGVISRHYLPQSSSFAIKDVATNEYVFNHDENYTQIGRTNNTLNYFDLDTNGLFPERHYCVEFKVNYYSGTSVVATKHYKPNLYFRIAR